MTQSPRGRSGFYQILVFVIILALILLALVVGGSGSSSGVTPTPVTTSEATSAVTPEPTTIVTSEATSVATVEATSPATVEATSAATVEAPATATLESTSEATTEATTETTAESAAQSIRFVSPSDGATVPETFDVVMEATGLTVEPAGAVHEGAGHFHILIDTPFIEAGQIITKDETHLHFGQAQTSTSLTLTPGTHVLRLQFANGEHTALEGDQYRAEITVNVAAGS